MRASLDQAWTCRLLLLASLALALPTCSSAARQNPRESLTDSLRDYHNQLVWGRWAEAAGYLPAEQRSHFIGTYDDIGDDLQFTEFEVGQVNLDSEREATVIVTVSWYRVPYYVVEETRVREIWEQDEEDDYWWLVRRGDADEPREP